MSEIWDSKPYIARLRDENERLKRELDEAKAEIESLHYDLMLAKQEPIRLRDAEEIVYVPGILQENERLKRELESAKQHDLTTAVIAKDVELSRELEREKRRYAEGYEIIKDLKQELEQTKAEAESAAEHWRAESDENIQLIEKLEQAKAEVEQLTMSGKKINPVILERDRLRAKLVEIAALSDPSTDDGLAVQFATARGVARAALQGDAHE